MPTERRHVAAIVVHYSDGGVEEFVPRAPAVLVKSDAIYKVNDKRVARTYYRLHWEAHDGNSKESTTDP